MTEGPYELPEGWRWVRLGEVCEIHNGRTPRKHEYRDSNTGTKILKFRDLTISGDVVWDNNEKGFATSGISQTTIKEGDVLITSAAHTPEQIGRKVSLVKNIPLAFSKVVFVAELLCLRPRKEKVFSEWLHFWLLSESGYRQIQTAVKEKHLVKTRADFILIPLPPLAEQERIVDRLEAFMDRVREARRLRQEAQEEAKRLWEAVLSDTFPRAGSSLPPGWRWVRLGEVAKAINGCGFPKRFQGRQRGSIAFLKVSDLNSPENDPEVTRAANYVDQNTLGLLGGRACKPGTIVFPKIGGAIATNKKRKLGITAAFDNNVMGLLPNEAAVCSDYLLLWTYTIDLASLSKVGPVPSIRQSTVENQQISLPPLAEQRRIVAHLEAVQEKIRAVKAAQAQTDEELRRLEQAILDRAFRGEL